MSELKEFTSEQMKGVPSFELKNMEFVRSDGKTIYLYRPELKGYDKAVSDELSVLECNPIDRMNACCKGLFELMPDLVRIELVVPTEKSIAYWEELGVECNHHESTAYTIQNPTLSLGCKYDEQFDICNKISINPFLHTERTSITREELGL